ncbi:MAG: methyltransferase domain-containing protein, partial [Planctomycetota bacterium]
AVLEHLVDPIAAVDEMSRACRPGGCIVVTVPNVCYVKHIWSLLRGRVPLTGSPRRDIGYWREHGWDGGHLHYFSKKTLDALLRHVGFIPERWTGCGYLSRLRRWYSNFVGNLTVRARKPGP